MLAPIESLRAVADHPARKARRSLLRNATLESMKAVTWSRKGIMFAAKVLDRAGDRRGAHLARTAATSIDDLLEHLRGAK